MSITHKLKLLILGVHSIDDGYPNVKFRISGLLLRKDFEAIHICFPFTNRFFNSKAKSKRSQTLRVTFLAGLAHFRAFLFLWHHAAGVTLYIPYPGVLVCLATRLLPQSKRPRRIILDAFISIYDTAVVDRKLFSESGFIARCIYRVEKLGLSAADVVVVDTQETVEHMRSLFGNSIKYLSYLPLATDEQSFFEQPLPDNQTTEVLFIGTLIPLHGVQYIVNAIEQLADCDDIHFTIVGSGQDDRIVEECLKKFRDKLTWHKEWATSEVLADFIKKADICLGIFGDSPKTQRVCPLKMYAYLACSRPIITRKTLWTESTRYPGGLKAFYTVAMENHEELAFAIKHLANDKELRKFYAKNGRVLYQNSLNNEDSLNDLADLLKISKNSNDQQSRSAEWT